MKYKVFGAVRRICKIGYLGFALLFLMLMCENSIIERAAYDYFPCKEGNWWRYSDSALYDPQIILVEVEPKDTVLMTECFPFSYSGEVKYFAKSDDALSEYIKILYNFSGQDYTIIEGFVKRIELPLVEGVSYQDSLCDSLELFGSWVKAKYMLHGLVSEYQYDELYGNIYKVVLTTTQTLIVSDSVTIDVENLDEYYAPNIGLVQFNDEEREYKLIEYHLE